MGTNTNVATVPSHILLDIHHALQRRAHVTNVADWAIGNLDVMEGYLRNPHKTPTKDGKKGGRGPSKRNNEVGTDQNQRLDEINVASVGLHQKE